MHQDALSGRPPKTDRSAASHGQLLRRLLLRKIWLPRSAYAALPYLYIFLGLYSMLAALYLGHWSWIIPYLVLIGVGCVHAGAIVLSMRWRQRSRRNSGGPGK